MTEAKDGIDRTEIDAGCVEIEHDIGWKGNDS